MDVVSPTSVAAPCRLEDTAMAMMTGTGLMSSFLASASATGATISTVATLSTKAEISPANRESATTAHLVLGTFSIMISAISAGMRDSINSTTVPMVPAIISRTFQSMAAGTSAQGRMPSTTKSSADAAAIYARYLPKIKSRT